MSEDKLYVPFYCEKAPLPFGSEKNAKLLPKKRFFSICSERKRYYRVATPPPSSSFVELLC